MAIGLSIVNAFEPGWTWRGHVDDLVRAVEPDPSRAGALIRIIARARSAVNVMADMLLAILLDHLSGARPGPTA